MVASRAIPVVNRDNGPMHPGPLRGDAPAIEASHLRGVEMSTIIVGQRRPPAVSRPFTGRARWAAAALLVTGAALQVVEFLLENPLSNNAARVADWGHHLTRVGLSESVGLVAVAFLLGGVAVMVALSRAASPRLAWTAGCLLV